MSSLLMFFFKIQTMAKNEAMGQGEILITLWTLASVGGSNLIVTLPSAGAIETPPLIGSLPMMSALTYTPVRSHDRSTPI
jgi:hypothetical protein